MTCVEAEKMVVPYMKDELSRLNWKTFLTISIPVRTAGGAGDPQEKPSVILRIAPGTFPGAIFMGLGTI